MASHRTTPSTTTQTTTTTSSVLIAGINRLISLLEEQARAQDTAIPQPSASSERGDGAPRSGAPGPRSLEDLDLFVMRLNQVKEWLQEDPRLLPVVDDYIGVQVRAMEHRQTRQNVGLAVATTVVGALLGWGVSLLGTPASLLHHFIK